MAKKKSAKEETKIEATSDIDFELDDKSFTEQVFEDLVENALSANPEPADEMVEGEASPITEKAILEDLTPENPTVGAAFDEEVEINVSADVQDTELAHFDSAEIEEVEEISQEAIMSAVESLLFASDRPQSAATLKAAFQGTKVRVSDIRSAIERLQLEYANATRGVVIDEVAGGYQIRTKPENQKYLLRTVKARPFRLSGPALEVLAIVAYKQPATKSAVDEIRGVESGHLMRGLLDRGLIHFAGKSDLPGRPMTYETTRKFLEIFNLRNIQELPTFNEIDQLIPEGIGEDVEAKPELKDITGELSTEVQTQSYSIGEEEMIDISSELKTIETTTAFFEDEKLRQRQKRDADRAQDLQERLTVGEVVEAKDRRWLAKYEAEQAAIANGSLLAKESSEPPHELAGPAVATEVSIGEIALAAESANEIATEEVIINESAPPAETEPS